MSHKVRVKDGAQLGGYDDNGARLYILPEIYNVDIKSDNTLIFSQANKKNGGDLYVNLSDYLELENFPDIYKNSLIEIL